MYTPWRTTQLKHEEQGLSPSKLHRGRGTAQLGLWNSSHGALGHALGLVSGMGLDRRRGRRCRADDRRSRNLKPSQGPPGRLGRRLVRVRGSGRGVMHDRRRGLVEDELLNGHNLLAVAEFLQLAQQRLDLLNQVLSLGAFQLAEYLLC